jgi:predicted Zn-dependent peptidase
VILMERHDAPVFSYATVVNTGSAQEVPGITGLAHMFEHMAFKGSDRIGSDRLERGAPVARARRRSLRAYDEARRAETGRDENKVKQLEKAWNDAIPTADKCVREAQRILRSRRPRGRRRHERVHRVGCITVYFFSLPSNRFELWAFLESERFRNPVFREFYKERDVVTEERRMRTESSPFGRLIEQFLAVAFTAHPYGFPVWAGRRI